MVVAAGALLHRPEATVACRIGVDLARVVVEARILARFTGFGPDRGDVPTRFANALVRRTRVWRCNSCCLTHISNFVGSAGAFAAWGLARVRASNTLLARDIANKAFHAVAREAGAAARNSDESASIPRILVFPTCVDAARIIALDTR